MKPHRRKNTPPRRESENEGASPDPAPESAEPTPQEMSPDPSTYEAPEQPYVDPGEMHVDPGQVEATGEYVETNEQAYVDPNQQAYVDPNQQAYVDPNQQAYVDPNQQAYVDPNQQAYVDPNQQAYVDPNQQAYEQAPEAAPDAGIYDEAPVPAKRKRARKKVPKKSGARRRPAGGPGTRPGRPGSYPRPAKTYGGGVSVMTVFLGLCAIVMVTLVVVVLMPKNLSHISGYPAKASVTGGQPDNILDEVQKVMIQRDRELVYSEEEINTYLNARLKGKQEGLMSGLVKFEGVYVDFTPGYAEIVVERSMFGLPITLGTKIRGEQFRRQVLYKPSEWSIGKLSFKSRNIKPIIEMFVRLRDSCMEEYQAMKMMSDVRFEENQIVLDPTLGGTSS